MNTFILDLRKEFPDQISIALLYELLCRHLHDHKYIVVVINHEQWKSLRNSGSFINLYSEEEEDNLCGCRIKITED